MSHAIYDGPIIDSHCHIASTRFIPTAFLEGFCANVHVRLVANGVRKSRSELLDTYLAQSQDHFGDALVADMTSAGIEQAVVLLPDFTYVMKSDLTIAEMYAEHHAILQRHGERFHVFGGMDPRWGADGVALFEKGVVEYGFSGLKLYPPCGYSPSDKRLYPLYEICRAHRLPVLLHVGPTSPALEFAYSHPDLLDRAAFDFPDVNFILAHGAVHHVDACARQCAYRPNVYLDVSAFLGSQHPGGWPVALAELFRMNINHKILFGTDWPVFRNSGGHRKVMEQFLAADGPLAAVAPVQRKWLMSGNTRALLPASRTIDAIA
ncbi:amidohydrolase family protein [Burkholderia sp. AU45388]|uniref:amidohydrolase family protein n=1 Tax=Burkholderia sp. AU45388 TaxID=3059206 RepID=UPI00264AE869|nr:amidohydrolase family protein [Burkholderia sp. AU45388]MDN7431151.1 amidohydrolase family protein [Burkholderia sp. AU45388]